jgi:outer membrane receptor protein involved in Fe transport
MPLVEAKFGFTWEPRDNLSLRAAYFESVVRPQYLEQTIEPTQVAGFNQLYFVGEGAELKEFGFGVDAKLKNSVTVGADYTRKDIQVPWNVIIGEDFYDDIEHEVSHAYLHWTATDKLGLRIAYEHDRFTGTLSPQVLKTNRFPLSINYYWPSGLLLKLEAMHVKQKITRNGNEHDQDSFWNVDAVAGYRFPKRYGKVEIIAKNIFDESFSYYDAGYHINEIASPQHLPERQLFVRFSLNFL